jgi:hypothetical protein
MVSRDSTPCTVFQERFLRGQPQLDPVLDALADVLLSMWTQYDSLCTNTIIAAVFEFITYSCIEPEVEALPLIRGAQRIPWFLRERTGVAAAFALMVFPKTRKINLLKYIQAMPDMNFWISVTNDLLSSVSHRLSRQGSVANLKPHFLAQIS